MRKIMSVILTSMIIAVLSACGTNDTNPANGEASATQPVVEATKEAEPTESPAATEPEKEVVAAGPYDNLVDWVIGTDIVVKELEDGNRRVSNLPELSIMLPVKENLLETSERNQGYNYDISLPGTNTHIIVYSELSWAEGEDLCYVESMHKELTEYGKYTFDWGYVNNTANIAVGCPENDTSLFITFDIYGEDRTNATDEDKAAFEEFINMNVEHVREQVQSWDQAYVPTGELSSASASVSASVTPENTEITDFDAAYYKTYSREGSKCTFELVKGEPDSIILDDGEGNSYTFVLTDIGEGTYSATSSDGNVAFELYEEYGGGKEIYVLDESFAAFNGMYN